MKDRRQIEEEVHDVILDSIGEAVIIVDPEERTIMHCNLATESVFGYGKEELIGLNTSILHVNREYYHQFGEKSKAILRKGKVFKGEFQMKRKDGTVIETFHTVSILQKERGWKGGVVSVIRDITDQKRAEQQMNRNLREKTILLAEMHHRVKNNLAVMAGLLYMQIEASVSEEVKSSLTTSYCRLQSIAIVHEQLYQKAEQDAFIYLDTYLIQLLENIDQIIELPEKEVTVGIDSDHISIPLIQAVSMGLLLSELLVNAYQHAFTDRDKGHVHITAILKKNHLHLDVSDNGTGLPADFSLDSPSMGITIIKNLVQQLNAEISYTTGAGEGTTFRISFELSG